MALLSFLNLLEDLFVKTFCGELVLKHFVGNFLKNFEELFRFFWRLLELIRASVGTFKELFVTYGNFLNVRRTFYNLQELFIT